MYRPLRYQDRLAVMFENTIALGKLLDAAPTAPRPTTLVQRIWTNYAVKCAPAAEKMLAASGVTAHVWTGKLVAGQDVGTLAAFCEGEGWASERNAANVWTGATGRCKLWNDGSIMFILPA